MKINVKMREVEPYKTQDLDVYHECITHDSYHTQEPELLERIQNAKWIVDIGAHIGCFTALCRSIQEQYSAFHEATFTVAECCPENLPYLRANVGHFAWIHREAVTYEKNPIFLNSIFPGGSATGGSMIVNPKETYVDWQTNLYQKDNRVLRLLEFDSLIDLDEPSSGCLVDVLKLDCEGSEISIMEHSQYLHSRVKFIVGEWHDKPKFFAMIERLYPDWELTIWNDHQIGTFWLRNPHLA